MIEVFNIGRKNVDDIYKMIKNGASVPIMVTGSSMMPFLKPNSDMVLLEGCSNNSFKAGDILLFRRADGKAVLHRLRKINSNGSLVMNGDSQVYSETVMPQDVIARAKKIVKEKKITDCDSKGFRFMFRLWYPTLHFRPTMKKIKKAFNRKQH